MLILAIIAYAIVAFFEFRVLYKQKHWNDFWTNIVLGIFSLTIVVLLCLNVKIPSPAKPIQNLVTSIFGK
ncbi:hypothetical protein [Acetivibrio cellulolyticus]|uniref:hypothetical protein n=1 Tax=Acetivibrio cellulolyticus TaxID=35830 RepID=UPI0001E2E2A4|nr:hypothetical protein [Acetivibrio cellulolyticus]